ncbi:hypothetical protein WISP_52362 [Willisornis vidua]|uniref:Uncharacterized protein n=1 Tax=Willisornis vidua TaxID=1566151 RepID=A0ABQ9DDA9_9PASS|nr:hypothetical protein WISP_52362 [Willisornis vidua]
MAALADVKQFSKDKAGIKRIFMITITGLYLILITLTKPDPGLQIGFLPTPGPDCIDFTPGPDLSYDLDSEFNLATTSRAALLMLLR